MGGETRFIHDSNARPSVISAQKIVFVLLHVVFQRLLPALPPQPSAALLRGIVAFLREAGAGGRLSADQGPIWTDPDRDCGTEQMHSRWHLL